MSQNNLRYILIAIAITAISCKKSDDGKGKDLNLSAAEQQLAQADNAFTFKLLKEAASATPAGKNLMLSPLSVSMVLSMTNNGAAAQTHDAILSALGFGGFNDAQINSYYHHLINDLPALDPKTEVNIANSIWYRNTFNVSADFVNVNKASYNATVQGLDFNSAAAPTTINNWVSAQTNGKITKIVDNISSDMVMYLINAVYFKSAWQYKFDKSRTYKGNFYLADNNTVQTDMMNGDLSFNITSQSDKRVYELPYANGKYSMVILLPNSTAKVADIVAGLDTVKWNGWMHGLKNTSSSITLPKFKFNYGIKLNTTLSNLGMGIAFNPGADFTRINPLGGLQITEVMHKTYLDVNEEGTEAAAATSVGIGVTAAGPQNVINQPFLFAIRETKTGLILFAGIVNNPTLSD